MTRPVSRGVWRGLALALAAACFAGAAAAVVFGAAVLAIQPLVLGVLILVGVVFERWRYKTPEAGAPAGFVATPERFLDPETGRAVQVFIEPRTGERRYVDR
jgi:hypothetical protein